MVKPEQSKPVLGDEPPHWYGMPRYCMATPTTPPYCEDGRARREPPAAAAVWLRGGPRAAASRRAWRLRSSALSSAI